MTTPQRYAMPIVSSMYDRPDHAECRAAGHARTRASQPGAPVRMRLTGYLGGRAPTAVRYVWRMIRRGFRRQRCVHDRPGVVRA